jgi:hypothetical protein
MYKCSVDISYQGKKYYRNNYYDLVLSDKMKEFIKVGYFTAIVDKGVTKEFKGKIKKGQCGWCQSTKPRWSSRPMLMISGAFD